MMLPSLVAAFVPAVGPAPLQDHDRGDLGGVLAEKILSEPVGAPTVRQALRGLIGFADATTLEIDRYLAESSAWEDHPANTTVAVWDESAFLGEGEKVSYLETLRADLQRSRDAIVQERARLRLLVGRYAEDTAATPTDDDARIRLRRRQTVEVGEVVGASRRIVGIRFRALSAVVRFQGELARVRFRSDQETLLESFRTELDVRLEAERRSRSVDEDEERAIAMEVRSSGAQGERERFAELVEETRRVASSTQEAYRRLRRDLRAWFASTPSSWPVPPRGEWILQPVADAIGPDRKPADLGRGSWTTYFCVPTPVDDGLIEILVDDDRDDFDDASEDHYGWVDVELGVRFPDLVIPGPNEPRPTTVERSGTSDTAGYPDDVFVPLPQIDDIAVLGHGLTGVGNPWVEKVRVGDDGETPIGVGGLLPPEVSWADTESSSLVLVLRGRRLLEALTWTEVEALGGSEEYDRLMAARLDWDALTAAGAPYRQLFLRYKSELESWNLPPAEWKRMKGQDVVVLLHHLEPGTPAGVHTVRMWTSRCHWFHRGNVLAGLRFVRDLGDGQYEEQRELLVHDRVRVEVQLSHELDPEHDELTFALARDGKIVKDGSSPFFYAYRDDANPRVFRSARLHLTHPRGTSRTHRGDIPMAFRAGERISARLVPNELARTIAMARAEVITAPENVGAHWRYALWRAAKASQRLPEGHVAVTGDWRSMSNEEVRRLESESLFRSDDVAIACGDLAAMILLRDSFVRELAPIHFEFAQKLARSAVHPEVLEGFRESLRREMKNARHPIGSIEVTGRMGPRGESEDTVPFRKVFDFDWLVLHRPTVGYDEWIDDLTTQAMKRYVELMGRSLESAANVEDHQVRRLLLLTGHGFGPVAKRLVPRMVDLEEETYRHSKTGRRQKGFVWRVNRVARARVLGIETIGAAYRANEAVASSATDVEVAVLSLGLFAPATVTLRLMSLGIAGYIARVEMWDKQWAAAATTEETEFALGASPLLGGRRAQLARLAETPTWARTLGFVGGALGLGGDFARVLSTVRTSRAITEAKQVVENLERVGPLGALDAAPEDVAKTLVVLRRAKEAQEAGRRLDLIEKRAVAQYDLMVERLAAASEAASAARMSARNIPAVDPLDPRRLADLIVRGDDVQLVVERKRWLRPNRDGAADPDGTVTTPPAGGVDDATLTTPPPGGGVDDATVTTPPPSVGDDATLTTPPPTSGADDATVTTPPSEAGGAPGTASPPGPPPPAVDTSGVTPKMSATIYHPAPTVENGIRIMVGRDGPVVNWYGIPVSRYLSKGAYAQVFERVGGKSVVKVYAKDAEGMYSVERTTHFAKMLTERGIPQIAVTGDGIAGGFPYVLQDVGTGPGKHIYAEGGTASTIINGVRCAKGRTELGGKRIPRPHAVALCRLYKKIADEGLIWFDGHLKNICFVEDADGNVVAKVLDHDQFWIWAEPRNKGIMGKGHEYTIDIVYDSPNDPRLKIRSMAGQTNLDEVIEVAGEYGHYYPGPELFMMKMLERWRFIHYDRTTGKFIDGSMELRHVKEVFENIDDPAFVDPDLLQLWIKGTSPNAGTGAALPKASNKQSAAPRVQCAGAGRRAA